MQDKNRNSATAHGLSFEEANLILSEMTVFESLEVTGNDLHIGEHPKHGRIFLMMPFAGESILIVPAENRE